MAQRVKRIKDIMTTGVITVTPQDAVQKGINLMADKNISCVVVVEGHGSKRPVGIVTERDLVKRVLKPRKNTKTTMIKAIMTSSIVSISEEASPEEAMRVIESMKIRRVPVVNDTGVVGLVTQSNIVRQMYDITMMNKRLTFHQNVQSYIIIALAAIFIIIFIIRFYFI